MGTIIEFPTHAVTRRLGSWLDEVPSEKMGTVLILPVIRIERNVEVGGRGPEEGTAPGRRRRRRARS